MAVDDWSTVASSNTSVGGVNIAEHCPARNLNDGMREIMAEAKSKFDSIDTSISTVSLSKADLSGATFTGNVTTLGSFGTPVAVSGSVIDLSLGTVFTKTITADTSFYFTNVVSVKANCFSLILTNGGNYTITWPSSIQWAEGEVPDLTESGKDVLTFLTSDGGRTWYGAVSIFDAQKLKFTYIDGYTIDFNNHGIGSDDSTIEFHNCVLKNWGNSTYSGTFIFVNCTFNNVHLANSIITFNDTILDGNSTIENCTIQTSTNLGYSSSTSITSTSDTWEDNITNITIDNVLTKGSTYASGCIDIPVYSIDITADAEGKSDFYSMF